MIWDSPLRTRQCQKVLASETPKSWTGRVRLMLLTLHRHGSVQPLQLQQGGFTLVELILLMIIFAIVAAAVIPGIGDMTGMRMSATVRKLQSDIAFAQSRAMSGGQRYRVYFNLAPAPLQGYAVVNNLDGDANWGEAGEFARDPVGGDSLSVILNAGTYAGVTISAVGFSGSFVEFDSLGRPYDNLGLLAAANTVTLAGGSATQTVTVTPETGRVTVP